MDIQCISSQHGSHGNGISQHITWVSILFYPFLSFSILKIPWFLNGPHFIPNPSLNPLAIRYHLHFNMAMTNKGFVTDSSQISAGKFTSRAQDGRPLQGLRPARKNPDVWLKKHIVLRRSHWIGLRENLQETMVFTCCYHHIYAPLSFHQGQRWIYSNRCAVLKLLPAHLMRGTHLKWGGKRSG